MAGPETASAQETRDIIDLPLEVKAGGLPGEFEGYGAVFGNVDRDGDVVTKGAFADSLKGRLPALLWQHNPKEPIGRFDVVREDAKGLFVKGRLSQTGKGAEAYELLKMGALNGLSIGFVTKEAQRSGASGARQITRADLMEVSLVTFPANELARVQTVKQKEPALNIQTGIEDPSIRDPRSFERFLRENGFSRSRAKTITAKGFKGSDDSEVLDLIANLKERQEILDVKSNGILKTNATKHWSPRWETVGIISPPQASSFTIAATSWNDPRIRAPFKLKVRYRGRNRMREDIWLSHGGAGGNGPYLVNEGMQAIQIKAMAESIPQRIVVRLQ